MDPSEQKEQQQKKKSAVENYYFVARRRMTRQRHPIRRRRSSSDPDFEIEPEHRNYYQTSQRLVDLKFGEPGAFGPWWVEVPPGHSYADDSDDSSSDDDDHHRHHQNTMPCQYTFA